MWSPVKIEMWNLFSHPHSAYEFKQGTCTVIFGRNLSDKSLENNGAGKTTLFEAVCIALTGDSLRKIDKEVFINNRASDCKIVFDLHNAVLKMSLRIVRTFFRGSKTAKVELWENGVLNTQMTSVLESNKRILELLGISREDLLRYYIISQDNHYTFFTASDGEKKEIMNRITSADMILPIIDEIDKRLSTTESKNAAINEQIVKLTVRKSTLEEQIQELISANSDEGAEWTRLEEKAKSLDSQAVSADQEVVSLKRILKEGEAALQKIKATDDDLYAFDEKIKKHREILEKFETEQAECRRMESETRLYLEGEVQCPKCGERFAPKSNLKLTHDEAVQILKQLEESDAEMCVAIRKRESLLEADKKARKKVEEEIRVKYKLGRENDALTRRIEQIEERANDYRQQAEAKRRQAQILKEDSEWKKQVKALEEKVKTANQEIESAQANQVPVIEELNLLKFWKFSMGRSGFQTYLANRSVKIIEGATNGFLVKFGVDIRVNISGFKILKSGELREKIDIFVSNDGVNWSSFMGKSGGERGRVMLAGVLGIQRLINLSTNGRGIDLLLFDECFHGMDSKGQENIIKVFEHMGNTIMVITQDVSESFNNENTLMVVKDGGESCYV